MDNYIIAFGTLIVACATWYGVFIAKSSLLQLSLQHLYADYSTAEMYDAISSLWDYLKERDETNLTQAYKRDLVSHEMKLKEADDTDHIAIIKTSIHNKRRMVSQFYQFAYQLLENKVISIDIFKAGWKQSDLEIIPKILIPMESCLGNSIQRKPADDLQQLWNMVNGQKKTDLCNIKKIQIQIKNCFDKLIRKK